jgi:hypothetical protein
VGSAAIRRAVGYGGREAALVYPDQSKPQRIVKCDEAGLAGAFP